MLRQVGGGTAGTLFEFLVDSVQRGDVTGRVIVDISVDHPGKGRARPTSVGRPPPIEGKRYRVEAYWGGGVGDPVGHGRPRLFVTECGGSLRLAATEPSAWSEWRAATMIAAAACALLIGLIFTSARSSRQR